MNCSPHDWATSLSFFTFMHWRRNHSSVLAWRSPGTGEPGGLPSMALHRVGHEWSNLAAGAGASSSVHVISRTRILEWVTISFSKGSSGPRDGTHCRQTLPHSRQTLYHLSHQGTHQGLPSSWGRKESGTTFTDISINPRCIFPIFLYFHLLQLAFCLRPSLVTHLP